MKDNKNEIQQEVTNTQEDSYRSGSVQYIDSREVAEMVGKNHKDLLRDIRRYCKQMQEINQRNFGSTEINQRNLALSDFFIESMYMDGKGEKRTCYKVTLKGCEFIAHKLTGEKGTKFTATYINRFHEMEDRLEEGEYGRQLDIIFDYMEKGFQKLMERQERFEQMVIEKWKRIEDQASNNMGQEFIRFPTIEEDEDGISRRRRELNKLVNKLVKVCGWDKNFSLHRLYKTLEEVLAISLDDYLDIYRVETCNAYASTLEVVASYDRLYETAVNLCSSTIKKYL